MPVTAVLAAWSPISETYTNTVAPTADFSSASRAECAISDGLADPGSTGVNLGSASCAFNLSGNGNIPSGTRVAYLILKAVPSADAYQLALDVDGPGLIQNTTAQPAFVDQYLGPVAYAHDNGPGLVDVYYYLTSL